ncbi:methyltransferase [Acidipropionibacterium thoenii]|uniref:methyltransferase n=1 Tax=Acidipropionibacterium thoenii TaxID=1751 RepID=UPI00048915D1
MDDPVDDLIVAEAPAGARHIWVLDRPGLIAPARELAPAAAWCDDLRELRGLAGGHSGTADSPLRPDRPVGADGPYRPNGPVGADGSAAPLGSDPVIANPLVDDLAPHQIWMELPQSLDALDETLSALHALAGRHGVTDLQVVAGGRIKRMNRSMNEVAARYFDQVHASLGRRRARVLHFAGPRSRPARGSGWPRRNRIDSLDVEVVAHGGVFHVAGLDAGTGLLLSQLETIGRQLPADRPAEVLDLGCGNGVIAASVARRFGEAVRVAATDVSWLASDSARLTAAASGVEVAVSQADGLESVADASLDLILTNPPFHRGTARDSAPTLRMLAEAARVLRPGGQLWAVYNSHLPWARHLAEDLGPTRQVSRNRAYTVTRTVLAG